MKKDSVSCSICYRQILTLATCIRNQEILKMKLNAYNLETSVKGSKVCRNVWTLRVSNCVTGLGTVQLRHSLDIRHGCTLYSVLLIFNSFFVGLDWQGLKICKYGEVCVNAEFI
jgi:hypothetical protein